MKYLFLVLFAAMGLSTVVTVWSLPSLQSEVPVIYWATDANPARHEQIELFHQWLVDNGHVTEDGRPIVELRLDAVTGADLSKRIIQGVSGVAADIMDVYNGNQYQQLHAIGLLADVTDTARAMNFSVDATYPAMVPDLTADDRQHLFPANVNVNLFWVNKAAFERVDQPLPPTEWSFDEFESLGKAYVEAANPPTGPRRYFFANEVNRQVMYRSLGLSMFNETLTACTLDDPRYVEVLQRIYRWTYEDRILPTPADLAALPTDPGHGGAAPQLFNRGNFALHFTGRWMIINYRLFNEQRQRRGEPIMRLGVVEPPHGGFRNSLIETRAAGVYAGGEHVELATLFLAYLASEPYNSQIVVDGDALPPAPQATEAEAYRKPVDWPNEWGSHEPFAEAARTIAIANSRSPYVLGATAARRERDTFDRFMNHLITAEQAATMAARTINAEIQRTIEADPALRDDHAAWRKRQAEIEARRAAGQPVPAEWIRNPFHLRYYTEQGWLKQ